MFHSARVVVVLFHPGVLDISRIIIILLTDTATHSATVYYAYEKVKGVNKDCT